MASHNPPTTPPDETRLHLLREFSRAEWHRLRAKHGFWKALCVMAGRGVEFVFFSLPTSFFRYPS